MSDWVRAPRNLAAGLLFVGIGAAALGIGAGYRLGSLLSMGPGYFPRIIGCLLLGVGVIVALTGLRWHGEPLDAWRVRPLVLVLGSILLFGWCLERYGLIAAVTALILPAAYATRGRKILEVAGLVVVLNAVAWLIFIEGLGLPLLVWPETGAG